MMTGRLSLVWIVETRHFCRDKACLVSTGKMQNVKIENDAKFINR